MFDVRPGSSAPLAAFVLVNGLLVSSLASLVSDPAMMQVRRPAATGNRVKRIVRAGDSTAPELCLGRRSTASLSAPRACMQGIQTSNPEFAGLVVAALPVLAAYASLYVVGPLLRLLGSVRGNARAARGNALRREAAAVCPPSEHPAAGASAVGGRTGGAAPLVPGCDAAPLCD